MTTPVPVNIERLYDLLADRATVGLTAAEAVELSHLLARWPHVDPDEFDRAAAATHLSAGAMPLPLPPDLQAKLEADAAAHFRFPVEPVVALRSAAPSAPRGRTSAFYWAVSGWSCAAAVLAGFLLFQFGREPTEPTVAQKRDRLAADPTAVSYAAAKPDAPTGRVVFSVARQEGYLELKGLPPNDPAKKQYQLWIVDKGRPHKEPVDGGVFDANADGTALVAVRSPLPLRDVAAFAVTVESPGGVVVSEDGKQGKFVVVLTP